APRASSRTPGRSGPPSPPTTARAAASGPGPAAPSIDCSEVGGSVQHRIVFLCAALVALGACAARRELIAREGPNVPFSFPYVDPSIPGAPDQFGGAAGDPTGAPRIAYPLDGAMHPSNIGAITFQWTRGDEANRVFRIRLDDGRTHYDFYVPCTVASCLYAIPPRGWLSIAYAHPDATLRATIEGTNGAGGAVIRSPAIAVRFSPDPVT